MNVPSNIFTPKATGANDLITNVTGSEITTLIRQARLRGGVLASWRMQRTADSRHVALVEQALEVLFEKKRDELHFRAQLALDAAKKRAVADGMADVSRIEREITRMTAALDDELTKAALDVEREAAREEVRRIRDAKEALARSEITEARFQRQLESIERRTDEVSDRAQAVALRVIENLGERLAAALRLSEPPRY
jgi:hypothetical protein